MIPDWTDETNSFEHVTGDGFTHSTRDGAEGYVVGGDFASSEISQTQSIPDGFRVGARAVLTFQRGNIGDNTDDLGRVYLEALSVADAVLLSADTGDESFSPADEWTPRRLVLDLPEGATQLRVRLVATRDGGSGVLAAAFDDFDLRVHKLLDPSYVYEIDFTAPSVQPTPATWPQFHLAWPDLVLPEILVAHGIHGISAPRPISSEGIAWSDVTGNEATAFVGQFGALSSLVGSNYDSRVYREAFQFVHAGPHLQLIGVGSKRRGDFTSDDSFTVVVHLKVHEYGTGAGICGIRDSTSGNGWGVGLNSSGKVVATLKGTSGTKTATSAASIADGAPHQVAVVYSADDETLKLYVDRLAAVSTSTASGLGEFALPTTPVGTYPLRIGTDAAATDVFGGELLMFASWPTTGLTQSEVRSMWTYGALASGVEPQLSHAVWVPSETSDELGGTALVRCATTQAPIGYAGSSYGLALTHGSENLWPSNDTSETAEWVAESTVTATRSIQDNTGLARGIRIAGDATHGLVVPGLAIGASSGTVNVVVFARALSGTPSLGVELLSSADAVKDSDSKTLSTSWQRIAVTGLSWDGATATCKLRFRCASTFELAHVAWCERVGDAGERIPTVFQDAGVTLSNLYTVVDEEHTAQLNDEGELDVAGVATVALPASLFIASIGVTGDNSATRSLGIGASWEPAATHYDSSETPEVAVGSVLNWTQEWRLRARWNRIGIPSAAGDTFFGIVVTGSANSDVQDARTAAWTAGSSALDVTTIGAATYCLDCYVRRFAVRAREPRL